MSTSFILENVCLLHVEATSLSARTIPPHGLSLLPTWCPCAHPLLRLIAVTKLTRVLLPSLWSTNILHSFGCSLHDHATRLCFPAISMGCVSVWREPLSLSQPSQVIPGGWVLLRCGTASLLSMWCASRMQTSGQTSWRDGLYVPSQALCVLFYMKS